MTTAVNYLDSDLLHNVELLQRQRMLWVIDGSDQMYQNVKNASNQFTMCLTCEDLPLKTQNTFFFYKAYSVQFIFLDYSTINQSITLNRIK